MLGLGISDLRRSVHERPALSQKERSPGHHGVRPSDVVQKALLSSETETHHWPPRKSAIMPGLLSMAILEEETSSDDF